MAALITRLLSHYWTADDHEAVRKAQVIDWLYDMRNFSMEVFAEACGRWRIAETRRPVVADIYKLCLEVEELRRPPSEWTLSPPPEAIFPSMADHDYLRKKIRIGRGDAGVGYAALPLDEKHRWHAYDYAFRRAVLHSESSPLDPEGRWHDPVMAGAAEAIYRPQAAVAGLQRFDTMRREGLAAIGAWAREQGCVDIDDLAASRGIHWSEACLMGIKDLMGRSAASSGLRPVKGFASLADWGVTATEAPGVAQRSHAEAATTPEAPWRLP
jgi:hypothetical protein